MTWKHPVEYLITIAVSYFKLSRTELLRSKTELCVRARRAIVLAAVDKFFAPISKTADHLEVEPSVLAKLHRRATALNDSDPTFAKLANDLHLLAYEAGARPVRANRQQKLERRVEVLHGRR